MRDAERPARGGAWSGSTTVAPGEAHERSESETIVNRRPPAAPRHTWKFLTPLVWAPAFPFIRHTFSSPTLRPYRLWVRASVPVKTQLARTPIHLTRALVPPQVVGGAICLANLHGFWLINNPDLSDEAIYGHSR